MIVANEQMRPRYSVACYSPTLFILAMCLTCFSAPIALGDVKNPLNLPPPKNGKLGAVMFCGGDGDKGVHAKFVELAGGESAHIVIIPSGSYVRGRRGMGGEAFDESEEQFLARMKQVFNPWVDLENKKAIARLEFLYTDEHQAGNDPRIHEKLNGATGVWIPAAWQGKLSWRFTQRYPNAETWEDEIWDDEIWDNKTVTEFQRKLRDVVALGGVVAGCGGGVTALAEVMILGDKKGKDPDDVVEAVVAPGLALFNGAIVDQKFNDRSRRFERLAGLLRNTQLLDRASTWPVIGRDMIGLAVDEKAGLVVRGNSVEAIGAGEGHVFLKSNRGRTITWRILTGGDKTELLAAPSDPGSEPAIPAAQTQADTNGTMPENPFGMPERKNGNRSGIVVLHGGGGNSDMIAIFPTLAGIERPKLIACPAAKVKLQLQPRETEAELDVRLREHYCEWEEMRKDGRLAELQFISPPNSTVAQACRTLAKLDGADAVWFGGGDQNDLADLFVGPQEPTMFEQKFRAVLEQGGVLGGTSAGTAVMAKVMTVPGKANKDGRPTIAEVRRGFGILHNVILEQHLNGKEKRGGRIERFTNLLRGFDRKDQMQKIIGDRQKIDEMIGLAVEERTALVLQENYLRAIGTNRAHVFLKSKDQKTIIWHELRHGDSAKIHSSQIGPVLELLQSDEWQFAK